MWWMTWRARNALCSPLHEDVVDGVRHGAGAMTRPDGGSYTGAWADGTMHGEGSGRDAESGVTYTGSYAAGRALAIPISMEVMPPPPPPPLEGEEGAKDSAPAPLPVGTPDAPVAVIAGGEPIAGVTLCVRLPWVPPPPPPPPADGEATPEPEPAANVGKGGGGKKGEGGGKKGVIERAVDVDEAVEIGDVAAHESGRWLRCTLHEGLPEQPPAAPDADGNPVTPPLVGLGRCCPPPHPTYIEPSCLELIVNL
jgi:hypothetical protein